MKKGILITAWTLTAVVTVVIILSYILNFYDHPISENPENWGQFGDFMGGLLNPFISIINLFVLTYISFALSKIEENRNKWTIQELARPLGQIICGDYEDVFEVKLKNCGLGPLRISDIIITNTNGKISNSLINEMPEPPKGIYWSDFIVDGFNFVVAKDTEINIIKIEGDPKNEAFNNYKKELRETLKNLTIRIEYKDIYDRQMNGEERNLQLFARRLK